MNCKRCGSENTNIYEKEDEEKAKLRIERNAFQYQKVEKRFYIKDINSGETKTFDNPYRHE